MATQSQKIEKPSKWLLMLEARALWQLGGYFTSLPFLKSLEKGDGHPVLVIPGFIASDKSTRPLRYLLKDRNYKAHPWKLGRNLGRPAIQDPLLIRLKELFQRYEGEKVSVIGWSLGGIFARVLAQEAPQYVRQVITLGSPFAGLREANNARWLYEAVSGKTLADIPSELFEKVKATPTVPFTSIYSKTDGVVSWQHCLEKPSEIAQNVEVHSSHFGMGHDPSVLACIINRLGQEEGDWKHFKPSNFAKFMYPNIS